MRLTALLAVSLWALGAGASPPEKAALPARARNVLVTGSTSSMVLDRDGAVWSWGTGRGSEHGTWPDKQVLSATPRRMEGLTGAISLARDPFGGHALALLEDGTVLSWGTNLSGQLGDGTRAPRPTRERVVGLSNVVSIAAGANYSLAVREDGTLWGWGSNSYGTLGDGTRTRRLTPNQVPGLTQVVAAVANYTHSLALREDGTVWAWGSNTYGQLGNGTTNESLVPLQVQGLTNVVAVAASPGNSYALRGDGTVWA